jgi:hemerythrin-like domain-containing protein
MTHMDKEQNEMYRLVSSLHPDVLKEQTKEWYRKKLELEEKERTTKKVKLSFKLANLLVSKVRRRTKGFNDGPDVGFP